MSNIVQTAATLFLAYVGLAGLNQWKKKLKGKSDIDLAKNIIRQAIRFRENFKLARSAYMSTSEWQSRKQSASETSKISQRLNQEYAFHKRLKPLRESLIKLEEFNWEAETIWGQKINTFTKPLYDSYFELRNAIEIFFNTERLHAKEARKLRDTIYDSDNGKLASIVDEAVSDLKKDLNRYIK